VLSACRSREKFGNILADDIEGSDVDVSAGVLNVASSVTDQVLFLL